MNSRQFLLRAAKWASVATDFPFGKRRGPRILIYHQVGEDVPFEMNVTREAFIEQLDWLSAHGDIVDLGTSLQRIGHADADDTYVLTFDDGHRSVFESVFPILEERDVPFTLYLSTRAMEEGGCLHGDERMPLVTWEEVGQMLDSNLLSVGAHSHGHLDMRVQHQNTIHLDLAECDRLIHERLGLVPRHFAYPWGHWSNEADALVRARYQSAAIGSGPPIGPLADRYKLSRIPVMASDSDVAVFARKMWGGFRFESALRALRDRVVRTRHSD